MKINGSLPPSEPSDEPIQNEEYKYWVIFNDDNYEIIKNDLNENILPDNAIARSFL